MQGADLDAIDTGTGIKLYTPSDNSNTSGVADFVVPSGTYDIDVCAPFALRLASRVALGVSVTGPTNGGVVMLDPGNVVSGTVRDTAGNPLEGVDLDAFVPGTGTNVSTCFDDSGPDGTLRRRRPRGYPRPPVSRI